MLNIPGSRAYARERRKVLAARAADDAVTLNEAKTDSFVQQFIEMTPTEVANYIENNVTDLASAKTVLKKMGVMILLLARKEYRDP